MEIKENYSNDEWALREKYYMDSILALKIPDSPTSEDIKILLSCLDRLMTEAVFEQSYIERRYERANLELKNAEIELFNILKQQQLLENAKITEADVKSLVKTYLKNNPIGSFKKDIYSIIKYYMDRLIFLKSVVKTISEKKGTIISMLSILKLESNVSPATKDVSLQEIEL